MITMAIIYNVLNLFSLYTAAGVFTALRVLGYYD